VKYGLRAGESLSNIGRKVNKHAGSVFTVLKKQGGISPAQPYRSKQHLTFAEREEISRGIASKVSIRSIARLLGRSPSTISREINRHGGREKYRAVSADNEAWNQSKRPKQCLLDLNFQLVTIVKNKLELDWSPQQISGWLKVTYPNNSLMQISHETIYRSLYLPSHTALGKQQLNRLRSGRVMRQSRKNNTKGSPRGQIINAISIHERPKEVKNRRVTGHWEGDLISGSNNSHIATIVERKSRFTLLVKLTGKDTQSVVSALIAHVKKLPINICKSLTWDRGMELADHKRFTQETKVKVFFCDPQSPWQRGTNENTNRLLRQYLPKGTNLYSHSQEKLNEIASRLNDRPRKVLGFISPNDKLGKHVALTC